MNKNIDIVCEIIIVVFILIKFFREDIVENCVNFIVFLNEIGVMYEGRKLN